MRFLAVSLTKIVPALVLAITLLSAGAATANQCQTIFGPKGKERLVTPLFDRFSGWPAPLQRMADKGVFDRYWDSVDAKEISKKMIQRRSQDVGYWGPDFMLRLKIYRDKADPGLMRVEIPGLFLTTETNEQAKTGTRPKGLDTAFVRALAGVLKGIEKELKGRNDVTSVLLAGTDIRNPMLIEGMTKAGFEPFETLQGGVNLGVYLRTGSQ